jgi:hypothetical protein
MTYDFRQRDLMLSVIEAGTAVAKQYQYTLPDPSDVTADLIEAAADAIESSGWAQDVYIKNNSYCVLGALGYASAQRARTVEEDHRDRSFNFAVAQTAVGRHLNPDQSSFEAVTHFNDALNRTSGEVVDMLKSVAKDIRNG